MKTTIESIERDINTLYEKFYEGIGIDPKTGDVLGTSKQFIGCPYVGMMYPDSKKQILFVGLDQGKDEGFHTFDSKRRNISYTIVGKKLIPKYKAFNPHFYGIYAMTLRLLYKEYGWVDLWNTFSRVETRTACEAISNNHNLLPVDLLDYISFTNAHKLVTVNRENRSGSQDRRWNDDFFRSQEIQLLEEEIRILEPHVIIFQGVNFKDVIPILKIDKSIHTIVMYHPSCHDRFHRSIAYINQIAEQIDNN